MREQREDSEYSQDRNEREESQFKINDSACENQVKVSKRFWTPKEDQKLMQLVDKYGQVRWTEISMNLPGRSAKRCRERWMNYLDTTKNHSNQWTFQEKWILFLCYKVYGNKWSVISKIIKRGDNIIKNQVNCLKRKKMMPFQAKLKQILKSHDLKNALTHASQLEIQMIETLLTKQKNKKSEKNIPRIQPNQIINQKPPSIDQHMSSFRLYNPTVQIPLLQQFYHHYNLELYNSYMNSFQRQSNMINFFSAFPPFYYYH